MNIIPPMAETKTVLLWQQFALIKNPKYAGKAIKIPRKKKNKVQNTKFKFKPQFPFAL
jgi:hypothetical protein